MAAKDSLISKELLSELFEYKDGLLFYKSTGKEAVNKQPNGYKRAKIKGVYYFVHRLVYMMHNGFIPKYVDHIDGNRSNNTIENLRQASANQNSWNKLKISSFSGIKGIDFYKSKQKWRARCTAYGQTYSVGYFSSISEAAQALQLFRSKLHGQFAKD